MDSDEEGETVTEGEGSPFFVGSSGGCDFVVVVGVVSAVSDVGPVPTAVAVAVAAVMFPSTLGFDDAAPPLPPFPFAPLGGDDLQDEDEFAVKYLYLFMLPSPPPLDWKRKTKRRERAVAPHALLSMWMSLLLSRRTRLPVEPPPVGRISVKR